MSVLTNDKTVVNPDVRYLNLQDSTEDLISAIDSWSPQPKFIHVAHATFSKLNANLIRIAVIDESVRQVLTRLSVAGYYVYKSSDDESRLVRHDYIPKLWNNVRDGEFRVSNEGIIYKLEAPNSGLKPKRLLIVMSAMHENIYTASLMRHFMQNFQSVHKYLPKDTLILRIADIGGVVGAFYLNTQFLPNNIQNIQRLIESIGHQYSIGRDSRVIYGVSKGGTGALYHSIIGGYRCVAVDPIVSDEHYVVKYHDSHFTATGIFPETKQSIFIDLVDKVKAARPAGESSRPMWSVIYSERSPQFKYINSILVEQLADSMVFLNSRSPEIMDHPDVGGATVNSATMLMNSHLYGLHMRVGVHHID
ncbi:XcbB/CpsF family capsular polysaccharide biosynthesis protein [Specibacter sp. RAF43]|uniref:XcbB/CpsF family capsular polysaccharide biosynthesis protein n=1 Tax=Specibacter sp. RAF43 TaxID=3233057 RepID=UPI003F9C4AC0